MFDHNHYVPILKAKQSERLALGYLNPTLRDHITPLFEIQAASAHDSGSFDRMIKQIKRAWDASQPLFIDCDPKFRWRKPKTAGAVLDQVLENVRQDGYCFIPVTGMGCGDPYQAAVKKAVELDGNGLCLRLDGEDWSDLGDLSSELAVLLRYFNVSPACVDVVLDFETFSPHQAGVMMTAATTTINNLPRLSEWRTLTLAGTAFPSLLNSFTAKIPCYTPRSEWTMWQKLVKSKGLMRRPAFGDYTVVHPEFPDAMNFALITIEAKIKYATDDDWLIIRWHKTKGDRAKFYDICDILTEQSDYCGKDYCWGDKRISLCAKRQASYGSPSTWVQIGINHHLTLVANQIASSP